MPQLVQCRTSSSQLTSTSPSSARQAGTGQRQHKPEPRGQPVRLGALWCWPQRQLFRAAARGHTSSQTNAESAAYGGGWFSPVTQPRSAPTLVRMTLATGGSDGLPQPPSQYRSFAVTAFVGRRIGGWPFARFDIGPQALRVRLPFPWFTRRTASMPTVTAVTVFTRFDGTT